MSQVFKIISACAEAFVAIDTPQTFDQLKYLPGTQKLIASCKERFLNDFRYPYLYCYDLKGKNIGINNRISLNSSNR